MKNTRTATPICPVCAIDPINPEVGINGQSSCTPCFRGFVNSIAQVQFRQEQTEAAWMRRDTIYRDTR